MSCKPKTFFSILILMTITLHLNSGFCSAKEASSYSGGSSMYRDLHNFADETGSARGLRSSALEYNTTNPNSKHLEQASSKNDLSAAFPNRNHNERLPIQTNNYMGKFPWRLNDSLSMHDENGSLIRSFHKRAFDIKAGFQGDAAASERPRIFGNVYSSKSGSNVPTVHCSGDLMTLTADGREFTHILVDRVNAAPLHLYQLPAYCGVTVRVTWKDLVLMAPFDGCYIMQENGSYVLSLLWWGSPIKISCPMTRMMSQPTPSVLCSHFGMLIQIEGAQEAVEKHQVKVNGEVLPLLSETCAYRINSPSDVVILHTTFTSKCVTVMDGENSLVIILDGKQFILSCPFLMSLFLPYLHSHPFHQPLQPNVPASLTVTGTTRQPTTASKPETYKPPAVPHFPYEPSLIPQFYPDRIKQPHTPVQDTYPIHPMYPPSIYQHPKVPAHIYSMFPLHRPAPPLKASGFSTDQYPSVPEYQIPQTPVAHTPTAHGSADVEKVPQHQAPVGQYYPVMPPLHYSLYPILCPPYPETFCSQYPFLYPQYPQTLTTTASQPTIQPMPEISSSPQTTYMPLNPPVMQNTLFPQLPTFPPVPPKQPPKIQSSSLNCAKNRLIASLPSAKIDSIKVKDMKTDTWFPIASVPAACDYTLRSRGGGVVLSSPLPGCHTEKLSSSVMSLSIRFWDSSLMKTRTLQLQCRYIGDIVGTLSGVSPGTLKPLHQIIPHLTTPPTRQPPKVQVLCSSQHMSVKLPPGPTSGLIVEAPSSGIKTQTKAAHLLEAPDHCGYSLKRNREGVINLLLPYSSCHMIQQDGQHKIILKYQTLDGRTVETLLSCQSSVSQECNVANDQQLVCGSGALSSTECRDKGCCYSADTKLCYYPMDECTVDRHFVFSVYSSIATPPLSPATLVTAGNSSCSPQKVTADFALFKIPLDECGVHRYEVGKTVIYMVEILNKVQSVSLNYGTITRDSPVRLVVECRYFPGSVVSVGYLVKSPSLGPSIKAQGVFGVQLRIAKDEHYNDFHPQYHQPLRMLLGKPLYLEVRLLNPPDPTAILLVHYCVAYPRSAKSAWILIYDGCPNFLDQTPTHKPPATPAEVLTNHVRRFTVTTFQFLPEDDNFQADEEIYFMCSTEVCLPSDGLCVEGCFGDPANVKS